MKFRQDGLIADVLCVVAPHIDCSCCFCVALRSACVDLLHAVCINTQVLARLALLLPFARTLVRC